LVALDAEFFTGQTEQALELAPAIDGHPSDYMTGPLVGRDDDFPQEGRGVGGARPLRK
jgi:hypothetical protein